VNYNYKYILTELNERILTIKFNRPEVLNAANVVLHEEMSQVFEDFSKDENADVAVVTGEGRAFSAGGDIAMIKEMTTNYDLVIKELYDTRKIVQAIVETDKPIVSAINGVAVGAGLAVALLADISVIGKNVRLTDGHLRFGVVAGDHSVAIWPLLTSFAKAKYYLLTSEFLTGDQAEKLGLVSLAVDDDKVFETAYNIAKKLADGPRNAIAFTKRALNHWVRQAYPAFEHSVALEMLTFLGPDPKEGAKALEEKRSAQFKH
jgi:enoyl-CoA hydratase